MPYRHQLRSRQRSKGAILAAVLLAFGSALLVITPARILAWTGLGFGSLTVPAATEAVDEAVAAVQAKLHSAPPLIEQYTFPAYAEWRDIEVSCDDCYSAGYGIGAELDAVDATAMSRLEQAAHVAPGAVSAYSRGRSAGGMGGAGSVGAGPDLAGVGGAGSSAGSGAGSEGSAASAASSASLSEASAESGSETRAAALSAGKAKEGGSPGGETFGESPEAAEASNASEVPNLLLSRIAPGDEPWGGPAKAGLPSDVVQALIESPVGSETTHSAGEPELLSEALDLEGTTGSTEGGSAQQDAVPEPMSLVLLGLGLSAVIRQRRAAR